MTDRKSNITIRSIRIAFTIDVDRGADQEPAARDRLGLAYGDVEPEDRERTITDDLGLNLETN